jgi:hypothetical protein
MPGDTTHICMQRKKSEEQRPLGGNKEHVTKSEHFVTSWSECSIFHRLNWTEWSSYCGLGHYLLIRSVSASCFITQWRTLPKSCVVRSLDTFFFFPSSESHLTRCSEMGSQYAICHRFSGLPKCWALCWADPKVYTFTHIGRWTRDDVHTTSCWI